MLLIVGIVFSLYLQSVKTILEATTIYEILHIIFRVSICMPYLWKRFRDIVQSKQKENDKAKPS